MIPGQNPLYRFPENAALPAFAPAVSVFFYPAQLPPVFTPAQFILPTPIPAAPAQAEQTAPRSFEFHASTPGPLRKSRQVTFVKEPQNPITRRTKNTSNKMVFTCQWCGTTKTPLMRRGPAGKNTLCNACGLKYMKQIKNLAKEKETVKTKMAVTKLLNPM